MAQLIRFFTGGGGEQRIPPTQARDEYSFLPQDSVFISDRTRHANKLGEGSFAKIYRGEYNGKPCAVKVFKEDVLKKELSPDPGSEGELLSKVQHTNVVQMYGMWYDPHKERVAAAIVMELCDESLYEFIRKYKGMIIRKEKKLPILRDTARGMVHLHGLNIIHCDLRSSNILLVHSGDQTVAKLADFDMAKLLDSDTQRRLTNRFPDEEYLPPEVFDHKEAKDPKKKWALLTPKVDVFCFGEVVLELACGSYPTPTRKYSGREMLTELKRRDKYLVKMKQSDKESLGSIVRKCLADAPESRPDFTEILHDVEGYLHKYGERPDLEKLQDKTAECELLRAQALKWEDDCKSLCSAQDRVDLLERELDITREEKQDLQRQLERLGARMTGEIELLQAKTAVGDRTIESLQKDVEDLATHNKNCELERDTLRREKEQWAKTEADLKDDVMKLHETCSRMENSRITLASQLQDAKAKTEIAKTQQKKISTPQVEVIRLKEEVAQLKSGMAQQSQKHLNSVAKCDQYCQDNKVLRDEADRLLSKLQTSKWTLDRVMQESVALEQQKQAANKQCKELQRQLDALRKWKQTAEKDLKESKKNSQQLVAKNRDLATIASQSQDDIGHLTTQLATLQQQLSQTATAKEAAEKEQKAALDETEKTKSELQAERDKLQSLEKTALQKEKELDQCKGALQAERDKLRNSEKAARQRETDLKQCKAELKADRDNLHRMEKTVRQKDREIEQCKESLTLKTEKRAKSIEEVTTLNHALEQKAVLVGELQDTIRKKETIIQQFHRDVLNMKQEVEKLMNQGDTLRQERDHLKYSLNITEGKFGSTAKERDHFQMKLHEKESTNARLLKSLRAKEEEMKVLKRQNATAESSSKGKDQRIAGLQDRTSKMDVQLKRERSEWTSERNFLIQELMKVEETAEARLKTAESSLAATTAQQQQASAAKEEMAATLQQLQEECDRLKQEHHKELAEKVEELIWLKKDVITRSKELEEAHEAINKGKAMELEQRKKIKHIEDDKKDLMDKLQKHTDKLEKKKKELTEAVDSQRILKQELDWKISVVEELKHERDRLAYSVQEYKRKLIEMATHNKDLEEQRDEEARECRSIKRDLETALADVVKQREMLSAKDVKLSKLEKEQAHSQSECDESRAQLTGVQQEAEIRLESLKASKAVVEKDLARARKMCRDLMDERLAVNAESEQKMDNLNDKLVEFKQVAVLSEERLGQLQGLKDEHRGLKLQLKKLTTALVDFQQLVTIERKSRKSLDASVKTLKDEVSQLRTELKGRNDEVLALASANMQLQKKADRADVTIGGVQSKAATLKEQVKQLTQDNDELKQTLDGAEATVQKQKRDYEDSQSKTVTLKEQVKRLSEANSTLKQTLGGAEAAVQKHKRDYEDSQTDDPLINPAVGSEGKEAAQKVQVLEAERDSYKAELHMYKMKWIATEDLLEAVKKEKQFLEEKLRDAEQQVAMLQSKRQQLEVLEGATEELKTQLSGLKEKLREAEHQVAMLQLKTQLSGLKSSAPVITVGSEEDETSATVLAEEAAQKVQTVVAERDSYKAERYLYQMKWIATGDLLEAVKEEKQFLEENLELTKDTLRAAKIHIKVIEQSMRDEDKKKYTVAFELFKRLLHDQEMEAVPVLPKSADVIDVTVDEVLLQQLCYMATAIKELLIGPSGGRFTLGSGDAWLEFPAGAVEKETSVRYAIILHGPFVFPAGYKPGSVIVYLNMDGVTLQKPVQLFLTHWCSRAEGHDEDMLKFATAPHTLQIEQQCYEFEEQEDADFTTHANIGILKVYEPQCLHCVKRKFGKIARYSAITFSQYIPDEDTLLYRIQLMCDSREWNKCLTDALRRIGWDKASRDDNVTRFEYSSGKIPIAARPTEREGHGWIAKVEGNCEVEFKDFLLPNCKSKSEIEQAVNSGQYPPCVLYKVMYSVPEDQRGKPTLLTITLQGEHLNLQFNCRIKEAKPASSSLETYVPSSCPPPEATELLTPSPASSAPSLGAVRQLSSPLADIPHTADVIKALNHQLDAKWREFGTFLYVDSAIMDSINRDKSDMEARMLQLVEKWMCNENGTGNLPRTWKTVLLAVKGVGKGLLSQTLVEQYGVQLSSGQ